MNVYKVVYERDRKRGWLAEVLDVPGCSARAGSLDSVEARLRAQLVAVDRDAENAILSGQPPLPPGVRAELETYREASLQARLWEENRRATLQAALQRLVGETELSVRDMGWLLGISGQRVAQLIERSRKEEKSAAAKA